MTQLRLLAIAQVDKRFSLVQAAKYIGNVCDEAALPISVNTVSYVDADVAVSMQFDPRAECDDGDRLLSVSASL